MGNNIIAISSTHGTSKTTTALLLAASMKMNGYNVTTLDEVARKCPFPINQKSTIATEKWIICTHIAQELELSCRYDYVIADRSVIDPYCYAKVGYPDYAATLNKGLLSFIKKHIEDNYLTTIILDKDSFSYHTNDGIRDMDPLFRSKVFDTLIEVTKNLNIPHKIVHNTEDLLFELRKYGLSISLPVGLGRAYAPNDSINFNSNARSSSCSYTDEGVELHT